MRLILILSLFIVSALFSQSSKIPISNQSKYTIIAGVTSNYKNAHNIYEELKKKNKPIFIYRLL
jgi:predicted transcriptional regulator